MRKQIEKSIARPKVPEKERRRIEAGQHEAARARVGKRDTLSAIPSSKHDFPEWMKNRALLPKRPPKAPT